MMNEREIKFWEILVDNFVATDEELGLACALCGTNENTLKSVLYIRTGYNSLEQFLEELGEE